MDGIMDIIKNITGFMTCFVPGYIFLCCFWVAACKSRDTDNQYVLINSVAISFIISVVTQQVVAWFNISALGTQWTAFMIAVGAGTILGLLRRTKWLNDLFGFVLGRGIDNNLLIELADISNSQNKVVCVRIKMNNEAGRYQGQISKIYSFTSSPAIELAYYSYFDESNQLICNFSDDDIKVVLNYSDIQCLEYDLQNI